jgi:hypothetical protein
MKIQSLLLRNSLLVLTLILALPAFRAAAQTKPDSAPAAQAAAIPARITQAIDETQLVRLQGNVHPLARPEFDQGIVADSQPMKRMLLLLQRSPEQQAALEQLMLEQQSKDSPNFHKWLTPAQFGAQFGPSDADIQTVTDWITRQGFQGIKVANGKTVIEFSGNAAQVRNAFHTEVHKFLVNGEARSANVADPQIPTALSPVVRGIVSLHNFPRKALRHDAGIHKSTRDDRGVPQFTTASGCGPAPNFPNPCYVVGPADFAKIYNIPSNLDGTGFSIGIVGDSNINPNDATAFRNLFGLLPATGPTIIVDGPDPGISGPPLGDEPEADLDVQVSGMVAPKATIDLVVAESTFTANGTDLAAFRIIDYNLTDVMSESFGVCEPALGTSGVGFYQGLWEQAAAQGITVMVAAGDNASAGCDNFNTQSLATRGLAVNGIASTNFNVAVGGTDFDDVGTQLNFWSASNAAGTRESAKGYIPETTWNDSCAAAATSSSLNTVCAIPNTNPLLNIVGGSGGPSSVTNSKPSWQSGVTPADTRRDLPDVSLFASDGAQTNSFYLVCEADAVSMGNPPSCAPSGAFSFGGAGGTSASSPAFAGIMALIDQKMGGRQGNANFVLYKLAQTAANTCNSSTQPLSPPATCIFYDVTKGNNSVPCAANSPTGNSPNCSSTTAGTNGVLVDPNNLTTPAWTAKPGYDYASGLGSVNVANLAAAWPATVGSFKGSTTSLTLNGGTSTVTVTHGTGVTAKATVASTTTGTPSGDVSLLGPPTTINSGINFSALSGGTPDTATLDTTFLPGGSYSVKAHYAGDGTFAPSDSNAVPVVVNKENSRLQMGVVTLDPVTAAALSTNANAYAYGSVVTVLRFDILNSTANPCQLVIVGGNVAYGATTSGCAFDAQGTLTVTDNGNPLDGGSFKINSSGNAEDQSLQLAGGQHTISTTYSGDVSYNAITTAVTDSINVSLGPTATVLTPSATTVTANQAVTLSVAISTQSISSLGPTGSVTIKDGSTTIGTVPVTSAGATSSTFAGATATLNTSFASLGTHVLTVVYPGDTNYATSTSTAVNVTVSSAGSFSLKGTALTVTTVAGTTATGMSTITVTPTGGFNGPVSVTCPAAALPPGVTCSPLTITVPNGAPSGVGINGTLTVNVLGPSTVLTASVAPAQPMLYVASTIPASGGKGWWTLSAGTGLAAMFLLLLPGRKRYRAALRLGLLSVLSLTLGCQGYKSGGGGGPVATTTKMTVNSAKLATNDPTGFKFTINVTASVGANGQVQLIDGGNNLGAPVTVSNGTATITSAGLAQGTHAISAHYLGDTYTLSSSSGMLNITSTTSTAPPTTFAITATPAPSATPPLVNITIN